jgi:hypothetical protein
MPGKTGLSSAPSPNIRAARSWASFRPWQASRCSAQRLTASTVATYRASCTSCSSASVAGAGAAMVTPGCAHSPSSFASCIVSSTTRTGAIGCSGPEMIVRQPFIPGHMQGAGHLPPAFLTPRAGKPNGPEDDLMYTLADIRGLVQIPATGPWLGH